MPDRSTSIAVVLPRSCFKCFVPYLPIVGGGSFYITKYDKKGTTILQRNPGFYGQKPNLDAVGITWFANADAMLAALKSGDIDYVDEVPFTVADQLGKSGAVQLVTGQGTEVRDFGFGLRQFPPVGKNQTRQAALFRLVQRPTLGRCPKANSDSR